jgi:hypothetical protein
LYAQLGAGILLRIGVDYAGGGVPFLIECFILIRGHLEYSKKFKGYS